MAPTLWTSALAVAGGFWLSTVMSLDFAFVIVEYSLTKIFPSFSFALSNRAGAPDVPDVFCD